MVPIEAVNLRLNIKKILILQKRDSRKARLRREDNIRIDFKEMSVNTRNVIGSAQDKGFWRDLVNATLNLRVPWANGVSYLCTNWEFVFFLYYTKYFSGGNSCIPLIRGQGIQTNFLYYRALSASPY